jgi:hypothetical protein
VIPPSRIWSAVRTNVALRIAAFVATLGATFAVAFAAGAAIDPDRDEPAGHGATAGGGGHGSPHADGAEAGAAAGIVLQQRRFDRGGQAPLAFRVVDRRGRTVRDFDIEHERAMHVIVVRDDLTGFQHLHPRQLPDGSWTVPIAFGTGGPHRVFADFVSAGEPRTLSAPVAVAGDYRARSLPAPAATADAGDGYVVTRAADGGERRFTVARNGRPVADLEPYLGARGHLVALRAGDLAYAHVHPKDRATAGRAIRFDVALPRRGDHRLFLQFKHRGEVRTAAFSELAGAQAADHSDHGEDGHAD